MTANFFRKLKKRTLDGWHSMFSTALKIDTPDRDGQDDSILDIVSFRKVIWVSVESVSMFQPNKSLQNLFKPNKVHFSTIPSFIWDGNWDLKALDIDEHYEDYSTSYRSMIQIFKDGIHYKQSDEYREKLHSVQKFGKSARGNNVNELNGYFESLLKMKSDIQKEGYRTQEELGKDPHDEVGVFIGRDGNIIKAEDKFCGTHRFALAKIMDLKKIPVCILAVHRIWADHHPDLLEANSAEFQKHFESIRSS